MFDFLSQVLSALLSAFKKKTVVVYAFFCGQITAFLYPDAVIKLVKQYIPTEATSFVAILLPFFKVCLAVYTITRCVCVWTDSNNELVYVRGQANYGWLCFAIHVCTSLQIPPSNLEIFWKVYFGSQSLFFIIVGFFLPILVIYLRKAFDKWKRKRKQAVIQHTGMEQNGNSAIFKQPVTPLPNQRHNRHGCGVNENPTKFAFDRQQSYGAAHDCRYQSQRMKRACFNAYITNHQR